MAKKRGLVVVICVLQGRPYVISDEEGEPAVWDSLSDAADWTTRPHILVNAAEHILIVDCGTGEVETL